MKHHSAAALALVAAGATLTSGLIAPPAHAETPSAPTTSSAALPTPEEGASDAGSNAALSAPLASVSELNAQKNDGAQSGLLQPTTDSSEPVTIIVQLEEGYVGIPWYRRIFGLRSATKHEAVKDRIADSLTQTNPGARIEDVTDYTNVLDGFAITAPASALDTIRATEGVKRAFIEEVHDPIEGGLSSTTALNATAPTGAQANPINSANAASLAMTGADAVDQKGDGQVIMVIDSGLDTEHPAFSGAIDSTTAALSRGDIDSLTPKLGSGKGGTWVSEKIPFAYDYADNDADVIPRSSIDLSHGTHVSGIATANGGEIRGVAPNAQLMMAKIGRDFDGRLPDSAILAALDDSVLIRPDVINMSLGSDAGMSSEAAGVFADVYSAVRGAGITLNVAAGNSGSAAQGNRSGRNLPYASDPDSSVVSEPSTYKAALSVASIDNALGSPYFTVGGRQIAYSQAQGASGEEVALFSALANGDYPYVDGGVGSSADVDALTSAHPDGLAGTIVLIRRGGDEGGSPLTFENKVAAVASLNPTAVVLYDNVDSDSLPNPAITTTSVPAVIISRADGEAILADPTALIHVEQGRTTAAPTAYVASDFSSWGVSPDLTLKPEIAAPGGNIYSSIPGGGYEFESGTSMATPQLAGISALVRQRVEADPLFSSMSEDERHQVITNLMMGTAHPVVDGRASDGAYYSPRKIGAGIADVKAATTTCVYPTVDGAPDASRPKADLGDGTQGWTFTVTLRNLCDTPATYSVAGQALSEVVEDGFFTEHSSNWEGRGIALSYAGDSLSGSTVTVPAHSSAQVSVSVTPGEAFASYATTNAPNGTFIDGYVTFNATDGTPNLSVPYLGFYGDWGQAPVFDAQWSENATTPSHMYRSALANSSTGFPLGVNPLARFENVNEVPTPDPSRYIVSNSAWSVAPNTIQPVTGTLRTTPRMTYTYTNEAGEVVRSYTFDEAHKSLYAPASGEVLYAEAKLGTPAFDGLDSAGNSLPDGRYTLTISADTDGPHSRTHTTSYTFTRDTVAPILSNLETVGQGEDRRVTFDVSDSSPLSAVDFHDPETGGWYYRQLVDDDGEIQADGTHRYHFEIPVSAIQAGWVEQGGEEGNAPAAPTLYAWDYGINASQRATAVITEIPMTSLSLSHESLDLAPGQVTNVEASHAPENANLTTLTWTSSNEDVATVANNGDVTGIGTGEATITATDAHNPALSARLTVRVSPVSDEVGIALSRSSLTVPTQGSASVRALLAPSLSGEAVEWTLDEAEGTSLSVSDDALEATVSGGQRSASTQLRARVTTPSGVKESVIPVSIQQADAADFVTGEDGTLRYYRGSASNVRIPDTVRAIDARAFYESNAETIHVPATVTSIGDEAFAQASRLKTVTFEDDAAHPSQLVSVGARLLDGNLKFDELYLPSRVETLGDGVVANSTIKRVSVPNTVTDIPNNFASRSAQLYDVTIGDSVTRLGDSAFSANPSLSTLTIRKADGSTAPGLPSALRSIGNSALSGTQVSELDLPAGLESIGSAAFALAPIARVGWNEALVSIGANAFSGTSLTEITLPDSVVEIGRGAFAQMNGLTRIHLGPNVKEDQLVATFGLSPKLVSIDVDRANPHYESVDGVLYTRDHSHLISYPAGRNAGGAYQILDGVSDIDLEAFLQVPLTSVTFPSSLRRIGNSAFTNAGLTQVVLPDEFEIIGGSAFQGMPNLRSLDLGGTIEVHGSAFDSDTSLTTVNFRNDLARLRRIGSMGFHNVPFVVLRFPDSLTDIGDNAFANNPALREVHIGASLTHLAEGLFTGNNDLAVLTVSPDNPVYSADHNVLYEQKDDGLHLVLSLPTNTFEEYVVRPGTVEIGLQAFRNNKTLRRVVLPEGLKKLGVGSFNNCENLTELVLPDSLEEVEGLYSTGIEFIEFGTHIRSISDSAFTGNMPARMVVRGGDNGSFDSSMDFTDERAYAAYFGEGMTHVGYGYGSHPQIIVLPSSLTSFEIGTYDLSDAEKALTRVYVAADENSTAWKVAADAMKAEGLNPDTQLARYTPGSLSLAGPEIRDNAGTYTVPVHAGVTVPVTATFTGALPQGRQVRFIEVGADGSDTIVHDWVALADAVAASQGATPPAAAPEAAPESEAAPTPDTPTPEESAASDEDAAPADGETPQSGAELNEADSLAPEDPAAEAIPAAAENAGTPAAVQGQGIPASSLTFQWVPTSDNASLKVEVRDDTYLTQSLTLRGGEAPASEAGRWMSDARGWWWRGADGTYPRGEAMTIEGLTYRFDENGYVRTGWVREHGAWYYHTASGAMASGWVNVSGTWYYLDTTSGAMATGWLRDGDTWYYLRPSGAMATGWAFDGANWYYLASSGAMASGWVNVSGAWYYLNPSNGAMLTGWMRDGGTWYYLRSSGAMATGWERIGGTWYRFSSSGAWIN